MTARTPAPNSAGWTSRPSELPGNFRSIEAEDDFVIVTIMNPESVQSRNRRQPHHERAVSGHGNPDEGQKSFDKASRLTSQYDVQFAGGVKVSHMILHDAGVSRGIGTTTYTRGRYNGR